MGSLDGKTVTRLQRNGKWSSPVMQKSTGVGLKKRDQAVSGFTSHLWNRGDLVNLFFVEVSPFWIKGEEHFTKEGGRQVLL